MHFLRITPANLKAYLPKFITQESTLDKILTAQTAEHERQRLALDDLTNQFFITSADSGLSEWEHLLQLLPNGDIKIRRNKILDRLQTKQTSTKEFFRKLITRYLEQGTGYIEEHNEEYAFRIILDEASLKHKKELKEAIELFKPAHLGYKFRHLCLKNPLPIIIKHHALTQILLTGKGSFWNLGQALPVIFDGTYLFDASAIFDGIKPDNLFKDVQTHKARMVLAVSARISALKRHSVQNKLAIRSNLFVGSTHKPLYTDFQTTGKIKFWHLGIQTHKTRNTQKIQARQQDTYEKAPFFDGAFVFNGTHDFRGEILTYPRHSLVIN